MTRASGSAMGSGRAPVVVVGAGLAGLVTALRLAPVPTVVLSGARLEQGTASGWAQGGIAAALGDDDSPARHAADTLAAGAGLCDPEVVARVTSAAPDAVAYLTGLGARFDRQPDGRYRLGLEGAHSRRRIVHADGDATGAEVLRAVVEAVRATPSITVLEHAVARRVLVEESTRSGWRPSAPAGRAGVVGVLAEVHGKPLRLVTDRVVLATGGSGQLWRHTTNPSGAHGRGLALAARAGAELRDLEMVQFHPTALDVGTDPMPLVSEAVRGAGAVLVDAEGRRLTDDPLAARDVVSRAVWRTARAGRQPYLDAREALGTGFAAVFPTVARACLAAGVDPSTDLVPVRPAAHYQCGGVTVDLRGRTTVPGLWAVGEVASTGLHGANRLASNSLLEAVVCAGWAAADLRAWAPRPGRLPGAHPCLPGAHPCLPDAHPCHNGRQSDHRDTTALPEGPTDGVGAALTGAQSGPATPVDVRDLMSRAAGVLRDGPSLEAAESLLQEVVGTEPDGVDDDVLVALLVVSCARRRRESRGGHARLDHPETLARAEHSTVTLAEVLEHPDAPRHRVPHHALVAAGGAR